MKTARKITAIRGSTIRGTTDWTEEEEFEILQNGGIKPEDLVDPKAGKRYAEWLQKNPPEEEATPST